MFRSQLEKFGFLGNFFCPQLCLEGLDHGLLFRDLGLFVRDRPITGIDSRLELGNVRCVIYKNDKDSGVGLLRPSCGITRQCKLEIKNDYMK
jgi:hypothetical protein